MIEADYDSGDRIYNFNYDLAGNRLAELLSGTGVTPTDRYFGYNAANQLIAEGDTLDGNGDVIADFTYEYDANGNLLYKKDITPTTLETYTWDRANRLLTAPGSTSYQYDGMGNRIQQTVSSVVTNYLLDTQPGLAIVLQQTTSGNVDRFIHGPRGIHAQQDNSGDWFYPVQDGLGSVRGVADGSLAVQGMQHYEPYGTPFGAQGSLGMPFGFTGEQTDANDLVYLRARYLDPSLGIFNSMDHLEGNNRYAYASGNPINRVDKSGLQDIMAGCKLVDTGGILIWICDSGSGENPDLEMVDKQAEREKFCRENPNHEDCEEWWNENDPRGCGCNTNYHPNSFQPFRAGPFGTAEADMLCNLDCYNGVIPYLFYRIGLSALGTGFQLIPISNTDTVGAYFEGNEDPGVALIQFGVPGINTAHLGGTIVVTQPSLALPIRNRATQLATLVEEIGHAAIWHGFFSPPLPPCRDITQYQNEFTAKTFKYLWMGLAASDVPEMLFMNRDNPDAYGVQKAFHRCNEQIALGCIDNQVLMHLADVGIM